MRAMATTLRVNDSLVTVSVDILHPLLLFKLPHEFLPSSSPAVLDVAVQCARVTAHRQVNLMCQDKHDQLAVAGSTAPLLSI
jgi:hypothetical protein